MTFLTQMKVDIWKGPIEDNQSHVQVTQMPLKLEFESQSWSFYSENLWDVQTCDNKIALKFQLW